MRNRLLAVGVLLIGLIFLISGCGGTFGKSLTKVLVEAGPHALNFPTVNPEERYIIFGHQPLRNSEITVEAWIQTNGGNGIVFARGGANGFRLFVTGGLAQVKIGELIATSTTVVNDGIWHHIAGVLTNANHDHTVTATCTSDAMSNLHIDIVVDGFFEDCAGVGRFAVFPTEADIDICDDACTLDVIETCSNTVARDLMVTDNPLFDGTVDEVRLWKAARSTGQIKKWMGEEISGTEWDTADPNNTIAGYWKFNEGTGDTAIDSSGYGNNGTKLLDTVDLDECLNEIPIPWTDGWVEGYSF